MEPAEPTLGVKADQIGKFQPPWEESWTTCRCGALLRPQVQPELLEEAYQSTPREHPIGAALGL